MSESSIKQESLNQVMIENSILSTNNENELANNAVPASTTDIIPDTNAVDPSVDESKTQNQCENNVVGSSGPGEENSKVLENISSKDKEKESINEEISPEDSIENKPEPYSGISVSIMPQEVEKNEAFEERVKEISSATGEKEQIDAFSDDEIVIDENGDSSSNSNSDSDSSASDSSDDSSDDSDSETDDAGARDEKEVIDELEEEDEAISGPILSKNEIADEKANSLPADYVVPENAPLEYIGNITAVVEKSVIIKANVSGEFRILKDDSILCLEDRQLLGPLFETFGRLQAPVYRVKFNTEEEFEKVKDKKGSKVFYVVPDSQFVYTDTIKKIKGTDASNCHDEELPEEEQEYSDDEQELAAKQEKNRKRKQKKQDNGEVTQKKKPAATKPENSFVSYGFAQRQPEEQARTHNPQLQHHNPALHGASYTQPIQSAPSNYGVPYNQAPANVYGQALPNQAYSGQFQTPQPYAQQQAYPPPNQYGQYTQAYTAAYQNQYGQPYTHMYGNQAQQYSNVQQYPQQPYNQNPGGFVNMQHIGNQSQYGQPYQPQVLPQAYPGQQYPPNIQQPLPQIPQQTQNNTTSVDALQQLQQMVSQNLTKEKQTDS